MFKFIVEKVVGTRNERILKKLWPVVHEINRIYETYHALSDEDLLKKTEEFEARLRDGENPDSVMPEAFALVKEATRRLVGKKWTVTGETYEWDMIPFDVQLLGAIVLHQGKIAEMATGEGKTLVATMPLYLNALIGRIKNSGVHLVTVNDYLARRDREWMGPVYETLGVSVGVIQGGMTPQDRKPEYAKDIVYGTNNEFGFDYLRDNMVFDPENRVQRGHYYAIIDEVDSILIDEARTPLIISGPVEHSSVEQYRQVKPYVSDLVRKQTLLISKLLTEAERLLKEGKHHDAAIKLLQVKRGAPKSKRLFKILQEPGLMKLVDKIELELMKEKKLRDLDEELYYVVDEKSNSVDPTEKGRQEIQKREKGLFLLPDLATAISEIDARDDLLPREKFYEKEKIYREYAEKTDKIHAIRQLLKAYTLFEKDVDYVVMDGKVIIVDEFTGRLMPGRRWSDGLHEAVEAKEGVKIQAETQTLATITIQNYFRMYEKLAGMTGTAATEAGEFWEIYKLDVVTIPTNKPIRRIDYPDLIFKTKKEKYEAVIEEIVKWHKVGRPILVGTTSVEVSELLSRLLKRKGIPHQVLNAKHHEKEAHIVARAGQFGAVTIATNMAGRGTDIKLGKGVVKAKECAINTPNPTPGVTCPEDPKECIKKGIPCGLYVIGTERHEARRIDNQLRGRSGRQGDPGSSRFFLSLEDDLLRLFGSDKVMELMERFGGNKDEGPIESKLVTRALENAQKRVEMQNFEIRKRLLEYDDVMNRQREVIYNLRNEILDGADLRELILGEYVDEIIDEKIEGFAPGTEKSEWDIGGMRAELAFLFLSDFSSLEEAQTKDELRKKIREEVEAHYREREEAFGDEKMREYERIALLTTLDTAWREHLYALDHLKEGIFLRAYGNKDPLMEYKQESYKLFDELLTRIRNETIMKLFRLQVPKLTMPRKYRDRIRTYKPAAASATAAPRGQAVPPKGIPVTGEIKVEKASSRRRRRSKKKKK
ncbi:MAG: preprotein translocase subunit SecA [Candidatus Hydrothermae bacterium]|nr:preprotein translocase subunit SecA [Candidatus Hydrothermae bacterium]